MIYKSKKEFIRSTAVEIIEAMTEEQKQYYINNPNPIKHHMTLGIYIRNKYIHNNEFKFQVNHADDLSFEVINAIFARIIPKYKKNKSRLDYFYESLEESLRENQ